MNKINFYHSCPEFVLRGYDYGVSVVLDVCDAEVYLLWTIGNISNKLLLRKNSDYNKASDKLTVYGITLPCSAFEHSDELRYRFVCGEFESDEYVLAVEDAGHMPPLVVTELYLRPKGLNVTQFIEVMNPSDEIVDLYDYKLMFYNGDEPTVEDYICSLTLTNIRGAEMIRPFEVMALWPLLPTHHEQADNVYLTTDGFVDACMSDFPKPGFDLRAERDSIRILPIEASVYDAVADKYVPVDNISKIPNKTECTTLIVAPRDVPPEDGLGVALYRLVYNRSELGDRDTPVRYSSLWSIDVRRPSEGVVVSHKSLMSPGRLDVGQAVPDLAVPYPVIVPLDVEADLDNTVGEPMLEFTIDARHIAAAYIDLKMYDGKYRRYRAVENENGVWQIRTNARDIYLLSKLEYFITVYDGVRFTSLGTTEHPLCTNLSDRCGPYIVSFVPAEKYCYDNTRTPRIEVSFFDVSSVDIDNSILCVDKKNVSKHAIWSDSKVIYTPDKSMKYGEHSFEIMLCDKLGNKTYRKVNFAISKADDLNLYRGEIHSHTAFSDGIAGPDEAYTYARNVGKVDFFATTEHSHYLEESLYLEQCDIADRHDDPGSFVALYGYEMTWNNQCGLWGHLNVINSKRFYDDVRGISLPSFYDLLKSDENAVGMFNHPCLHWGNFHDYTAYSVHADRLMCLAEIKGVGYDREYMNMLALGWHASPAFNEDNHSYNWTTATPSTTYALAPSLTRENILDAFRRRRTYSTGDSTMKIKFRVNDEWMGGKLYNPSTLIVDVEISTESEAGIGTVSLVTEDNIVVASINVGALREYHWKLKISPDFDYYYVKVMSAGKYTVTAPVWIEGRGGLCVKRLAWVRGDGNYKPHVVTAKVKNLSSHDAKSIDVDFYLTGSMGFDLERSVPYRTVTIPELDSGKVACIECNVPDIQGYRRVSVVVRGKCGKHWYADTAMLQISPVKIAEILPKSAEIEDSEGRLVANPFPYIKLCNLSNRDISLDKYYTKLWTKTGKQPSEDRTLLLDGNSIKAGGVLTIWVRPDECSLSVKDFNEHYGVSMVEGEDLIITSVPAISSVKYSTRRLDLMYDKELMSRVEYNFVQPPESDINEGKAIIYDVAPNMIGTSTMVSNAADPEPSHFVEL